MDCSQTVSAPSASSPPGAFPFAARMGFGVPIQATQTTNSIRNEADREHRFQEHNSGLAAYTRTDKASRSRHRLTPEIQLHTARESSPRTTHIGWRCGKARAPALVLQAAHRREEEGLVTAL